MASFTESTSDSSGLSLAIRLRRDSAEAWRDLVELYGPLVFRWAQVAGLDGAAADDVVQEVFLTVHRSIGRFDPTVPGATFRGWLWRVTRNTVWQLLRKPHPTARGGSTAHAQLGAIPDPACTPLPGAEPPSSVEDTTSLLNRALRQIESRVEPATWEAFIRTTIHGEPAEQVAGDLGLTAAAVRKAKSRTLQRLRKQLGDQL